MWSISHETRNDKLLTVSLDRGVQVPKAAHVPLIRAAIFAQSSSAHSRQPEQHEVQVTEHPLQPDRRSECLATLVGRGGPR